MPLTNERDTKRRSGNQLSLLMAANFVIYAGTLVAVNALGHAKPASNTIGETVIGVASQTIDNSTGAAATQRITVDRNQVFYFSNSATAPLTIADIGKNALLEDDSIVSKTTTNNIVVGKVIDVTAQGVWVEVK